MTINQPSSTEPKFACFTLTGVDAEKFLQGQLTVNVKTLALATDYLPTAISNLKGRVLFGLWVKRLGEASFAIVLSEDCATSFAQHIKKYAAFSKLTLSEPQPIAAVVVAGRPTFDASISLALSQTQAWQVASIEQGNYWITAATQELFQPQELRLHQRGGVDYDKGCYLGQEVIARLWFKAAPKAWLHRVAGNRLANEADSVPAAGSKLGQVSVVNAIATGDGFEALVVARPADIEAAGLQVLTLPNELEQPVGRG